MEYWEEFSICLFLKGPNSFEITIFYANVETVNLFVKINYFKLKYNANYDLRVFAKQLTKWVDKMNKLIPIFDKLLFILNKNPKKQKSGQIIMEKGILKQLFTLAIVYKS